MQKKYALENIELLIHAELSPDVIKNTPPSVELLSSYIKKVSEQKGFIRNLLIEEAFSLKDEKSIEVLVQRYQVALINLADDVTLYIRITEYDQLNFSERAVNIITVYRHTLKCIEDLLTVIEKHFSRYFNIDEKLPESYKLLMQSEFKDIREGLVSQYNQTDIEEDLLQLMMAPFRKFINANNLNLVSYRELLYLKTLHREFSEFLITGQKVLSTKNILDLLVYLNFNSYTFFNYYTGLISKDAQEADTICQQIEKLAWRLKTISQVQTKPQVAYKIKDTSAKEQLLGWIHDEMAFLEKKQQLTLFPTREIPITRTASKITTGLSVKQLALMMRLFFDNGIIKHGNQTEMLTQVAGVIQTDKKENISPGNLRIKYYDIDQPTKNIVKDYLIKMTNQLHHY